MNASGFNPFEMAQAQFDSVADQLGLDQSIRDLLRTPLREYQFSIPVHMDDGTTNVFRGFRVQHNDARGPRKTRSDSSTSSRPQESLLASPQSAVSQARRHQIWLGSLHGGAVVREKQDRPAPRHLGLKTHSQPRPVGGFPSSEAPELARKPPRRCTGASKPLSTNPRARCEELQSGATPQADNHGGGHQEWARPQDDWSLAVVGGKAARHAGLVPECRRYLDEGVAHCSSARTPMLYVEGGLRTGRRNGSCTLASECP